MTHNTQSNAGIGNAGGMSVAYRSSFRSDSGNEIGNTIRNLYRFLNRNLIPFENWFQPTHSVLAFNEFNDPFEMPLMRTGVTLKNGSIEWVDEMGHFTYMTRSQMDAFLIPMI